MAVPQCPRCQRANPSEAEYCWYDGVVLRQEAYAAPGALPSAGLLPKEFVFPSQRRCRTLDEFVQGCQYEWEDARALLRQGAFAQFFTAAGRIDLARAAREAETQGDLDVGLVHFLNALPASSAPGPSLDLNPRRLILGTWRPGETRQITLQVLNQGRGLLQGKLTVSEGRSWLWVERDTPGDSSECILKAAREQVVTLRADTRGLVAPQSYSARLTVITNGGIVEVPVRIDLGSIPFARVPFQGVSSPRELAERMRANPKPGVPLLENGEIRRWFESNGWTYPIQGNTARGIAAVQQFFEAMGLSKPPVVQLAPENLQLTLQPNDIVEQSITLRTPSKKWVYAEVTSSVPWLRVKTPAVSGAQQAAITFEIDVRAMGRGDRHHGQVRVAANAGQELLLPVVVDVQRPPQSFWDRVLRPFAGLAVALLLYRLIVLVPLDVVTRLLWTPGTEPRAGTIEAWAQAPNLADGCLTRFVLLTCWLGPLGGAALLWQRTGRWVDAAFGANAGTLAGVVLSASLVCLLGVVEAVPRAVLPLAGDNPSRFAATAFWFLLVVVWWVLLGAGLGLVVPALGERGVQARRAILWPLRAVLEPLGLNEPDEEALPPAEPAAPPRQAKSRPKIPRKKREAET